MCQGKCLSYLMIDGDIYIYLYINIMYLYVMYTYLFMFCFIEEDTTYLLNTLLKDAKQISGRDTIIIITTPS